MALITLLTSRSPTIEGIELDAILEDAYRREVRITGFPIANGARSADHRILEPVEWVATGAVGNVELRALPGVGDVGGILSNLVRDSGVAAAVAGFASGLSNLLGSEETRASAALAALNELQISEDPITIDAGDIQLTNMSLVSINRVKNPQNEDGLEVELGFAELPTLALLRVQGQQPQQNELRAGDPAQTQAAADIRNGERGLTTPSAAETTSVSNVTGIA